ncbi:MAG: putative DNA binding domain-containing protein [Propionibacteriaceae bacterium]|nr:putative DNA binding domain-containing protein [Propionibacteriaceae bacterium]
MDSDEVTELLSALRRLGGEPESVEAKKALGGLPASLRETLSSFSNTAGGTVLLGVDEDDGFAVVGLPAPTELQNDLAQMARDDMTPPLSFPIEIVDAGGGAVVVAEVPPAPSRQRPVYVTAKGVATGSYLRSGDGDRRMSQDEIGLLFAARSQPRDDLEAVPGSGVADLDFDSLSRTVQRVRRNVSSFQGIGETEALHRLLVLAENRGDSPLTLAGLLAFGTYPQRFFPQLMVSVTLVGGDGDANTRFADNAVVRGSIPQMVADAMTVVRRHIPVASVMTGVGRIDRPEFPFEACREAIVNALLHRDYSPITRGTQVQVELTPDEFAVRSPGGLYGGLSVEELGFTPITSSRNSALASLLPDVFLPASDELVAENRASGIPAMVRLARRWGLPRPRFSESPASFAVRMMRKPLLTPAVQEWERESGVPLPTPVHELALAMLRVEPVTVADLRLQADVDAPTAARVLRDLATGGAAIRQTGRQRGQYVLSPELASTRRAGNGSSGKPSVAEVLRSGDWTTAGQLAEATGLARTSVTWRLRRLLAEGMVEAEGAARSPKRRYRWQGER